MIKKTKQILVVEDDLDTRETLKLALESEGYLVITALNGKIGLGLLKANPKIALILLDMMMPEMNGREFLDRVSEDQILSNIPVIILSADLHPDKRSGSIAYMKKPADLPTLLNWIEKFSH